MTDDTISRRVAIDAVSDLRVEHRVSWKDAVIDLLDELPTAERKGHWIGADNDKVKCNQCGKPYDWTSQAQYYDYCPSCGARMERDE